MRRFLARSNFSARAAARFAVFSIGPRIPGSPNSSCAMFEGAFGC
jgi:hypothetical protein